MIYMRSIQAKANKCLKSGEWKKRIEQRVDQEMLSRGGKKIGRANMRDMAERFIEVMQDSLSNVEGNSFASGQLGSEIVAELKNLTYSEPIRLGKNRYSISIYFNGELSRESLQPAIYEGISNIAALLNKGYDAGHAISGMWHGQPTESLPERQGAHFIEDAVRYFFQCYAQDYGIVDIKLNEIYN